VALSSLVEGLSLKVIGIKCPQTSDDSLFASGRVGALRKKDGSKFVKFSFINFNEPIAKL